MASLLNSLVKAATNSLQKSFMEFDFDKEFKRMSQEAEEFSKALSKRIKKVTKHIHNYFDKWIVDVDYNQETDTITSNVSGHAITVVVKKNDGSGEISFTTTIPDDVIVESLVQKYNPATKKAIFAFSKKDEV